MDTLVDARGVDLVRKHPIDVIVGSRSQEIFGEVARVAAILLEVVGPTHHTTPHDGAETPDQERQQIAENLHHPIEQPAED